jgi:hypothetical protein
VHTSRARHERRQGGSEPRGLVVRLRLSSKADNKPIARFAAPIRLHLPSARKRVPAFTADGKRWTPIPVASSATLRTGKAYAYVRRLSRAARHKIQITSVAGDLHTNGTDTITLTCRTGTRPNWQLGTRRVAPPGSAPRQPLSTSAAVTRLMS